MRRGAAAGQFLPQRTQFQLQLSVLATFHPLSSPSPLSSHLSVAEWVEGTQELELEFHLLGQELSSFRFSPNLAGHLLQPSALP